MAEVNLDHLVRERLTQKKGYSFFKDYVSTNSFELSFPMGINVTDGTSEVRTLERAVLVPYYNCSSTDLARKTGTTIEVNQSHRVTTTRTVKEKLQNKVKLSIKMKGIGGGADISHDVEMSFEHTEETFVSKKEVTTESRDITVAPLTCLTLGYIPKVLVRSGSYRERALLSCNVVIKWYLGVKVWQLSDFLTENERLVDLEGEIQMIVADIPVYTQHDTKLKKNPDNSCSPTLDEILPSGYTYESVLKGEPEPPIAAAIRADFRRRQELGEQNLQGVSSMLEP